MSARDDLIDEYGRADTAPLGTLSELRQKLDAYRAEVLAEVNARFAAMKMPEYLLGTLNAGTYKDAWLTCRKTVQDMAGEKATASAATATPDRVEELLDAIRTHRGKWTVNRVRDVRRLTGGPTQRSTARRDLAELHRRGHLQQHGPQDGRFYTLTTRKGGE